MIDIMYFQLKGSLANYATNVGLLGSNTFSVLIIQGSHTPTLSEFF